MKSILTIQRRAPRDGDKPHVKVGFGSRLCENAGSPGEHATIESGPRSRRIFDAPAEYCLNHSCAQVGPERVFTRPRAWAAVAVDGSDRPLWVDLCGSTVVRRTAASNRKRGVQGAQGEPPGWVESGPSRFARPLTPWLEYGY